MNEENRRRAGREKVGHGGPVVEAYSMDLRVRVLDERDGGAEVRETAEAFGVSESWIWKLLRRRRETGAIDPKPHPGRTPTWPAHAERIRAEVERTPDATLSELRERLNLPISEPTLWRALKAMKLTLKKSVARRRAGPPRREGRA